MPKFKLGDKILADVHPAEIVSIKKENEEYVYRVKFKDKNLIPSEMDFKEKFISFQNQHDVICPVCKNRWKIARFNMHVWKDCEKCAKTSEQIIEEYENKPPPIPSEKTVNDILKEFEKMLEENDDDDFGLFYPGRV